ncbi:MAG: 5'/3'-nucleotidase SurE [Gammaproteobacteria bacterium]
MHLLLSNDDGIDAIGLKSLAEAMAPLGKISVVAPNRNRSAASNSLTLERPIRAQEVAKDWYSVDGTPTDCVHLAITGLLKDEPDIVVSGINAGANLGDDVIYSGTVAAAIEGRFLGLPAVAISLTSFQPKFMQDAAQVSAKLVANLTDTTLPSDVIININIPDIAKNEIKGMQTTRLGNRHKAEPVVEAQDPRGKPIYWVGAAGPEQDAGIGTDFHAVNNNYVSVSPMHLDLTHYKAMQDVEDWLSTCKL